MIPRLLHPEKSTRRTESNDLFAPPNTIEYSDSQDVTDLGVKNAQFARLEIGMRYKRILISYRFSLSIQDMYYDGLEKIWKIPSNESCDISAHDTQGKLKEKYSGLVLGFRLFRLPLRPFQQSGITFIFYFHVF